MRHASTIRGIVVAATGRGNMTPPQTLAAERALAKGVIVVVETTPKATADGTFSNGVKDADDIVTGHFSGAGKAPDGSTITVDGGITNGTLTKSVLTGTFAGTATTKDGSKYKTKNGGLTGTVDDPKATTLTGNNCTVKYEQGDKMP